MTKTDRRRPWRPVALVGAMTMAASIALIAPPAAAAEAPTVSVDLAGEWRFTQGDDPAFADPAFDDAGWSAVSVPGDGAAFADYDGFGWYRLTFTLPAEAEGANLVASLGFIDDVDEAFLNGSFIGGSGQMPPNASSQWFEKRLYPVPADAPVFGGENVLAVRVYDMNGGGGWYEGPVGIYSKDAVRENVYGIAGPLASAQQTAAVRDVLETQKDALAAGDADAYLATLDESYFHDGRDSERRSREIREWIAESGTLALTDSEIEVVVADDGTLIVDTNRTVTGTRNGEPFALQPSAQEFLRFDPATIRETGNRSRFFRESVDSALEGSPREFVTYLPPSYLDQPDREYPVVYLLHGVNGGSREWEPRDMDAVLDGLWADGLAESIVVMPDGESLWYLDGAVPWRSMFLNEMVPLVDAEYRTLESREFRALSGISMGGFGAFSIGLSNPDRFSSLASHMGSLSYTPAGPTPITQASGMTGEELGRFDLYFDACEFDEYRFDDAVRALDGILTEKGVAHRSEVYADGRHNDACWLPRVGSSFGAHSDHFRAAGLVEDFVAPELSAVASPEVVFPPNNKPRTVTIDLTATDAAGEVEVALVDIRVDGPARAEATRISDTEFTVRAVLGASYTFVYEATDAAGNTSTESVTVGVASRAPRG